MFRLLGFLITLLVIDSEFHCMGSIFSEVEFPCLCKRNKSNYFNHIIIKRCQIKDTFVFSCLCSNGFEGRNCEVNTDDCKNNPCTNNGTCVDLIAGYKCECASLYTGNHCETSELSWHSAMEYLEEKL